MSEEQNRFSQLVIDDELQNEVQDTKPENTKRQEIWASNIWTDWAKRRQNVTCTRSKFKNPPINLSDFATDEERDYWISKFVLEAKNADGEELPQLH